MKNFNSNSSVDTLTSLWSEMSKGQKEELLKARGLSPSWAEAKTMSELVGRGGGFVARDLQSLVKAWGVNNPNTTINFKDGSKTQTGFKGFGR